MGKWMEDEKERACPRGGLWRKSWRLLLKMMRRAGGLRSGE
jgi:hypothetical protein